MNHFSGGQEGMRKRTHEEKKERKKTRAQREIEKQQVYIIKPRASIIIIWYNKKIQFDRDQSVYRKFKTQLNLMFNVSDGRVIETVD